MTVVPTKLVQGSKIHLDIDPKKIKLDSRKKLGKVWIALTIKEYVTLAVFLGNIGLCLVLLGLALFWGELFILPLFAASAFVLRTHSAYAAAWSTRYKIGRKRVTRLEEGVPKRESFKGPATLMVGKDYPYTEVWETEDGMFY